MMEVDTKAIIAVVAALGGGAGSGLVASEISTQSMLAAQQVQIDSLKEHVATAIVNGAGENARLSDEFREFLKIVDDRLDRMDARKADR